MHLRRLDSAHSTNELGGWPDDYVFSTDAVAAFALLAATLETEAERMSEWIAEMRKESAFLWFVRGPEETAEQVEDDDA
jgi:hypothetical protein